MSVLKNIIGQRFGRLVVLSRVENSAGGQARWICECDCGSLTVARGVKLRNGHTSSCGCLQRERAKEAATTHNMSKTCPEYKVWNGIKRRCFNKAEKCYPRYGGRGITMVDRWLSFENFLSDMGPRPSPNHSIDRIDNEGNYGPDNCKWADAKEQANNRRSSHFITYDGLTLTVTQWENKLGFPNHTVHSRLRLGWPIEKILTTPVRKLVRKPK